MPHSAILTYLLIATGADARTDLLAPRSLTAVRASAPMRVDGVLDELSWRAAPVGGQFIQSQPQPGEPARMHTEFRVVFDDDAVYFGVRLDDPDPGGILAPLGRRDDENTSDWCFVEIDSRHDRRTALSFGVNPAGMQVEGMFVNDTEYDVSWNAVWEAAARVDAHGWTAEFRIPFAVLPFHFAAPGAPLTWGLNVYRYSPHSGESSNWSPRTPQITAVVSRFNELHLVTPPRVRRTELTPYASLELARTQTDTTPEVHAGADLAVGLSPGIELAATVLPDFGQVEADPTQLNLTAYELFQTERRPFFTEGIAAFRFDTSLALVSRGDSFADEAVFYSRRIGRAPEGSVPAGATTVTTPAAAPILGAVKLFGRSKAGWRFGALAAATGAVDATLENGSGGTTRYPVEPPTAAAVVRVVDEARDGDAAAGGFASYLRRAMGDGVLADQLVRDEAALGLDARMRWGERTYEAKAWALATAQLGDPDAIARLAEQPWHNFQRPDAPRLRLAPGTTWLGGAAADLRLARIAGDLQWSLDARAISPGFDTNGLGFQRNSDWFLVAGQWRYRAFPGGGVRSWELGTDNAGIGWSWGGERRMRVIDAYASAELASYWGAKLTLQHEASTLSTEWLRGGPALALPPRETVKLALHSDTRRLSYGSLDATLAFEPASDTRAVSIAPALTWRLGTHVAATLSASYEDQRIGWQPVAGPGVAPPDTYLVARVRQRTASLSMQVDVAVSPRLIVQLYAQPFVTVGRYDRYAELVDARAERPDDRFALADVMLDPATATILDPAGAWSLPRPDGIRRTLLASAVLRWELRPGSMLTAVWNHRGDTSVATPSGRLLPQLGPVFTEPGSDVVLVKLAWRFGL